jgi:hypothetical protein
MRLCLALFALLWDSKVEWREKTVGAAQTGTKNGGVGPLRMML